MGRWDIYYVERPRKEKDPKLSRAYELSYLAAIAKKHPEDYEKLRIEVEEAYKIAKGEKEAPDLMKFVKKIDNKTQES